SPHRARAGAMAEPLWRTPPGRLAPPHVYRMAGALGNELRRLSARFGPDAVAGLVPPVVRLLELLEALVAPAEGEASADLAVARLTRLSLPAGVALTRLSPTARKEREVMLRLKEVVDRQRDELRAQAHEIVCKSRDTEALQEQLHRFMAMNEELRHKVAVVQAQLKSALEHKSDLEAVSACLLTLQEGALSPSEEPQHQDGDRSPGHCCFSKEELQQILQERNELKTNLFLVQEELAYYQRELLNEERIPSFFLDAMKSNIKKQRKKIRAKMLGTTEESASREGSWDSTSPLGRFWSPTALICSLCSFGLWYQGSSKEPPTSSCSGTWEIIDSLDTQLEPEGESKAGSSSPDRAMAPL
uniref:Rab interacting lysosomal protein n=1 Tax=Catharus ustulatus TaxID=91951 RepID=A0A8C3Y2K5_CATUS